MDLTCSAKGCGQTAYVIADSDGRLLCSDCWDFVEDPSARLGSGFWEWVQRRVLRRA